MYLIAQVYKPGIYLTFMVAMVTKMEIGEKQLSVGQISPLMHVALLSLLLPIAKCWEILHASLLTVEYFTKLTLKKFSGILSECQSVLTQIRYDILSGLIWVQTVCKGYQKAVLSDRELIGLVLVKCLQMGH